MAVAEARALELAAPPRRRTQRLSEREIFSLYQRHAAGASLGLLVAGRWRDWGYASHESAAKSLRALSLVRGLAVRDARPAPRERVIRLVDEEIGRLHAEHLREHRSVAELARDNFERLGYPSAEAARRDLLRSFRAAGLPVSHFPRSHVPREQMREALADVVAGREPLTAVARRNWCAWGYASERSAYTALLRLLPEVSGKPLSPRAKLGREQLYPSFGSCR